MNSEDWKSGERRPDEAANLPVRITPADGGMHAEMSLGDQRIMMGQSSKGWGMISPRDSAVATMGVFVYLNDVDQHNARARAAGAEIVHAPRDESYGRTYTARDLDGHPWFFTTPPRFEIRIERFGWIFCPGDKVMQVENDYDKDVYNGDLGVVSGIDVEEGELQVDFDGRGVTYGFGELDELVLAYATTIHKSQGSEYPAVVVPLTTQHYPMLQRNLVYTGVTRGKRLVVLVGQRKALAIAVKGSRTRQRWSKLREWLIGSGTPAVRG